MRHSPYPLLAATAAGLLLSTFAGGAHALSCEAPGVMAPSWDATDVPTNTLIWCTRWYEGGSDELRVTDALGEPVSGTQTLLSSAQLRTIVFHPDAELAPNTRYSFQCQEFEGSQPSSFTTGAGPRTEPPAPPHLDDMQVSANADTGWGSSLVAWFRNISAQNTIVVLDLEGGPALDTSALSGSLDDVDFVHAPQGSMFVGKAPCVGNWPEAQLGASTRLRFGAFDLTGAFSGWTDWKTVTLPDQFEGQEGEKPEPVTPVPLPGPAPDELPGGDEESDEEVDEQTLGGTGAALSGAPRNDVVSADLASDAAAAPPRQSRGCQLGAASGSSWAAGLLAALAGSLLLRKRRTATREHTQPRS